MAKSDPIVSPKSVRILRLLLDVLGLSDLKKLLEDIVSPDTTRASAFSAVPHNLFSVVIFPPSSMELMLIPFLTMLNPGIAALGVNSSLLNIAITRLLT